MLIIKYEQNNLEEKKDLDNFQHKTKQAFKCVIIKYIFYGHLSTDILYLFAL